MTARGRLLEVQFMLCKRRKEVFHQHFHCLGAQLGQIGGVLILGSLFFALESPLQCLA